MKVGTKVRLTAKAVNTRDKYLRKSRIDWARRTGVVFHVTNQGKVSVIWEGNKSQDQLQLIEVERCNE